MDLMDTLKQWHEAYTASFRDAGGCLPFLSQLKLEHCRRVAADCRRLACAMGWRDAEVQAAEAMGLLHDVSRFEQVRGHGTFSDSRSFDHGEYAWDICRRAEVFRGWPSELAAAALDGIRYHNRRHLQEGLPGTSARFLRLVRDADKLDILWVINEAIRERRHEEHPEILVNVTADGPVSPALIAEIRAHGSASYEKVRTLADMNLLRTTWVHDINYLPSLRLLRERRLLEEILPMLPDDPAVLAIAHEAVRYVEKQLCSETVAPA